MDKREIKRRFCLGFVKKRLIHIIFHKTIQGMRKV